MVACGLLALIQVTEHASTNLVVDTFVERYTQGPPVDFAVVSAALVYFGRKICQGPRFTSERLSGTKVRSHILQ